MTNSLPDKQPTGVARLAANGQSPWYDNLTRPLARGGLDALVRDHSIVGVTSNPTIFEKAIAGSDAYDADLQALQARGVATVDAYWSLVTDDIAHAADRLRPVYDATFGLDGYVSVEVDPRLARETAGTQQQARELFAQLGRPNVMIKIPATPEGIPAIADAIEAGLNVNVTLIFSLERYTEVIDAYQRGLEARRAADLDVSGIASVASFFVSRVDTETDPRLPEGHPLRGRIAVANAKLAYELFEQSTATPRWQTLAAAGARVQRPLWASTSTKNPDYSNTVYVDELVGSNSVNTLADASITALEAVGAPPITPDSVRSGVAEARACIAQLADANVDFADVTATLEADGVASFAASFDSALATLERKARGAAA